jgi:hypothetical protein
MTDHRFDVGEVATLNYGSFAGRQVEIIGGLAMRAIVVIGDFRFERETYRALMPNGKVELVAPRFLEKRPVRAANADVLAAETDLTY